VTAKDPQQPARQRLVQLPAVSANRFPLQNPRAMPLLNRLGNKLLTCAFRLLYLHWIADSQSGMWVFRRTCLDHIRPIHPGMAFSQEIKIEAIQARALCFGEAHIAYSARIGEAKLAAWSDGWSNLLFLFRRRLSRSVRA
jgi:hypothetical protein